MTQTFFPSFMVVMISMASLFIPMDQVSLKERRNAKMN